MSDKRAAAQLMKDFNELKKHPVEGFSVDLVKDSDIFTWEIFVQGPPQTFYEGGAFRAILKFPSDFPYTPPKMNFTSDVWHPNVYWGSTKAGEVCISILHPPGGNPEAPDECESDSERWNPAHSVTTIILSVISMLSDPNFSSPANVDASVQWRRDIEKFKAKVKETVNKSIKELPPGFKFPKPAKYVPEKAFELDPNDDDDYPTQPVKKAGPYDSIYKTMEGMDFTRDQIDAAIKSLLDAGKKVHEDNVMEKLCN